MKERLFNLILIILAWICFLYSISLVNYGLKIFFFLITFPLIIIIAILFGREDSEDREDSY